MLYRCFLLTYILQNLYLEKCIRLLFPALIYTTFNMRDRKFSLTFKNPMRTTCTKISPDVRTFPLTTDHALSKKKNRTHILHTGFVQCAPGALLVLPDYLPAHECDYRAEFSRCVSAPVTGDRNLSEKKMCAATLLARIFFRVDDDGVQRNRPPDMLMSLGLLVIKVSELR